MSISVGSIFFQTHNRIKFHIKFYHPNQERIKFILSGPIHTITLFILLLLTSVLFN